MPTYEHIGLEVELASPSVAGTVMTALVREVSPNATWQPAHALTRISDTLFTGSVFGLQPGRVYQVQLQSTALASDEVIRVHTRPDPVAATPSVTYHVNPVTGSDSHAGTDAAAPFATLAKALSVVQAGQRILLQDGVYSEGDLNIFISGAPDRPIILENAPGATPVLDGRDPSFAPVWEVFDAGASVYRAPCSVQPDKAYLDGEHLFHFLSLDDLRAQRWGQESGYFVDGVHLYARFPGGAAPGGHDVTLPRFSTALTFDHQGNWQVRGLTIQYYGASAFNRGIYLDGADDILIESCIFRNNVIGVGLKRAANRNTIQDCVFSDAPLSTWDWFAVKTGGVGYEGGAFYIYASDQPNQGNVFRRNQVTDVFDGAHLYSTDAAGLTRDLDFYRNVIADCGDDAVETDGAGANVRIYGNTFRAFLTGVSVAPAYPGPTYVFRNQFQGWRTRSGFTGYPVKFNFGSNETTRFVYLYHNTCYTDVADQDGFLFRSTIKWQDIVSRNNSYAGTDLAMDSLGVNNPVDFDFDHFFSTHPSRFIRWDGVQYGTVAALAQATGQEVNGIGGDPQFVAPATGDFTPQAGSPLVDRGVRIFGINDAYQGSAPDVGAVERTSP